MTKTTTTTTTTDTTDTATAVSRMISGATYHARQALRLRRTDFEGAASAFAATPSATRYRAMEQAALALQDAVAEHIEACRAARREAIARFGAKAVLGSIADED